MKRFLLAVIFVFVVAPLEACSNAAEPAQVTPITAVPVAATTPAAEASAAPQAKPEPGKATVVGRVLAQQTGAPLAGTSVRLAEVTRQGTEGVYVLDGANSPGAEIGGDGRFVVANITAREYVLVVGDPNGKYVVIPDETTRAKIWNVAADQVLDVGELRVDLTP